MAANVFQLTTAIGTATAINSAYAIKKNKSVVQVLLANGALLVGLSTAGTLTNRRDIFLALAMLYLFASLITRGTYLLQSVTDLTTN